ncbi:SET and MYND domain-containing protein 4 [Arapaima gigas]
MDLPCSEWQRHVEKKWNQLPSSLKANFASLTEVDAIFAVVQSRVDCHDVAFLSHVSKGYQRQKDSGLAGALRERGNASFRTRDYATAARYYSQGVCNAAFDSDQLALCYANRSAALFHLHLYRESLEDIRRALDHDYPAHLQQKLLERRQLCLSRLGKPAAEEGGGPDSKGEMLHRTEGEGTEFPHLSPKVLLCISPEKGRHLVARECISPGEVVLEERAFGCVLIPGTDFGPRTKKATEVGVQEGVFGTEDLHCHHCLRQVQNPVPCPGCSYARYCGEECQQEAWQGHHCWECPVAPDLQVLGVLAHLALRIALRAGFDTAKQVRAHLVRPSKTVGCVTTESSDARGATNSQDSKTSANSEQGCSNSLDPPLDGSYLCVHHLLPHVSGQAPTLRFLCAVTAAALCQRLREKASLPSSWRPAARSRSGPGSRDEENWSPQLSMLGCVVLRHILQLRCNAQAVTVLRDSGETQSAVSSVREVRIATAVFPTLSLLNHSCRPNTSITFGTGAAEVRTLRADAALGVWSDSPPGAVTVTVRTTQTVASGQELQHCYGPRCSRMPAEERQRVLLEQYFFLCQCEACSQDLGWEGKGEGRATAPGLQCTHCRSPLQHSEQGYLCLGPNCGHRLSHVELDRRLQEIQELLDEAVELIEGNRPDKAARGLQAAMDTADRFLLAAHPLQGQLADVAARAQAAAGDWRRAAVLLSRSVEATQAQYGEDSAELAHQLFKLVQLHFNGGEPRKALALIPAATRLLSLHFGSSCEEMEELRAIEDCLQGAL